MHHRLYSWLVKPSSFSAMGIAGSLVILTAVFVPQIGFRGNDGESYSMLSHFVSELGRVGVSDLSLVFNLGLIVGGVLMLPFALGIGRQFEGTLARIAKGLGAVAAIGCSGIGFFPANTALLWHCLVAGIYFTTSFGATVLLSTIVLRDPKRAVPRSFSLLGLLVLIATAGFLAVDPRTDVFPHFDLANKKIINRPSVWLAPILEWFIALAVVIDILLLSLYFRFRKKEIHHIRKNHHPFGSP